MLELDTGNFMAKLQEAEQAGKTMGERATSIGEGMSSLGKGLTLGLTAPIVGAGTAIAKTSMDFESGMSKVQAISGATASDMVKLEAKAKEMGATTKFSASDSADALSYMAMAGWETNQMLDGLPGIMNLAAASGEELGMVSDIVTDALSAFGLQASDSAHFADVLAQASSSSNTNVAMMGETFKYVGPVAGALGYSIEDTSLAIGLMANAGIKGSAAGTTLRTAMSNLVKPTKEMEVTMDEFGLSLTDASGEIKPFSQFMEELRDSTADCDETTKAYVASTLFGKQAMSGMLAVMNASDEEYNKLKNSINGADGAAERMAKTMEDNVKGQLTLLKSNLEGVALQLGEILLPVINDAIVKINEWVTAFGNLNPKTKETILHIAGVAAAVGPLLLVGGKLVSGGGKVFDILNNVSTGMKLAKSVTTGLAEEVGGLGLATKLGAALMNPWVAGIAAGGLAVTGLAMYLRTDALPAVDLFGNEVSQSTQTAVNGFLELEQQVQATTDVMKATGQEVTQEIATEVVAAVDSMAEQITSKLEEERETNLESLRGMMDEVTDISEDEKNEILRVTEETYQNKQQTVEEGRARINEIYQQAADEHRGITEAEAQEITAIRENMKDTAIQIMSENEQEYGVIMQRMKDQGTVLSQEAAAAAIKASAEQRDKTVAQAEEEYNKRIKAAQQLKQEGTKESIEMANKIIEQAKKQRDETVQQATDMHHQVVAQAEEQAKGHLNAIDKETGDVKSKWGALKSWFANNPIVRFFTTKDDGGVERAKKVGRNAAGTNYWGGGYSLVGEHGPELVELPKNSKVHNNTNTNKMLGQGQTINNNFTVNAVIREDADIKKIAREMNNLQERSSRNRGVPRTI